MVDPPPNRRTTGIDLRLIDPAVFYGLLGIVSRLVMGPVTLFLIATHFSRAVQGYYFTFTSFVGFQALVELGLTPMIVQFAAHEWPRLKLDEQGALVGDDEALSRLISIGRFAFAWYGVGAILFTAGCTCAGLYFFNRAPNGDHVEWVLPWICLCGAAGFLFFMTPIWSLLEGCHQVAQVYRYRWFEAVLVTLSTWISIVCNGNLWTSFIGFSAAALWALLFLLVGYRRFLATFLQRPGGAVVGWKREMWPMQWRMAISFLIGTVTSLFTPMVFYYRGPDEAGQFGMTWTLFTTLGAVANLWTASKTPTFGALIAKKDFDALDRLFYRGMAFGFFVATVGGGLLWYGTYFLYRHGSTLAHRMLAPLPTGIFVFACILIQLAVPMGQYLRAHKQEPLMAASIVSGLFTGLLAWVLVRHYGALGIALAYTIVRIFLAPWVVFIWARCRRAWHATPALSAAPAVLQDVTP